MKIFLTFYVLIWASLLAGAYLEENERLKNNQQAYQDGWCAVKGKQNETN